MNNNKILKAIIFNNAQLFITEGDDGYERISFKAICDEIGLDWKTQKSKVLKNEDRVDRFGVILGAVCMHKSGEENAKQTYLIRLDRVSAFLYTVNPAKVAANGHTEAAEWLMRKHREWDEVIHAYESSGLTTKSTEKQMRDEIYKLDSMKDPVMRSRFAESINKEYGANLPVQTSMDV